MKPEMIDQVKLDVSGDKSALLEENGSFFINIQKRIHGKRIGIRVTGTSKELLSSKVISAVEAIEKYEKDFNEYRLKKEGK